MSIPAGCTPPGRPARSLGPAVAAGELRAIWVYLLAPLVGAAVGGLAYQFVRGEPSWMSQSNAVQGR